MTGPIKPEDVVSRKKEILPTEVFKVFNDLIAEHWNGHSANFTQNEVIERIKTAMNIPRQTVFDKHYLDVESIYRKEGWAVEYDKPGYSETYSANFTFAKKRKDDDS